MGAAESAPRKLTVKNEEPHIIEVTGDVLNRLRHGFESSQAQQEPSATQESTRQEYVNPNPVPLRKDDRDPQETAPTQLGVGSSGYPVLETVYASQVRKEKEEELRANDFFWRSKLKELEGRYVNSAFASEKEFKTQLENLQALLPKSREKICQDISPKLSACYAANPKQVLNCADLVHEFTRCVESKLGGKTLVE